MNILITGGTGFIGSALDCERRFNPDICVDILHWRWLQDRDDSPWYPGVMRLFRQEVDADWPVVVQKVAQALAVWVRQTQSLIENERQSRKNKGFAGKLKGWFSWNKQ